MFGFGLSGNDKNAMQGVLKTTEGNTTGGELSGIALWKISPMSCEDRETMEINFEADHVDSGKVTKSLPAKFNDINDVETINSIVDIEDDHTCFTEGTYQTIVPNHLKGILTSQPDFKGSNGTNSSEKGLTFQTKNEQTPSASWLANLSALTFGTLGSDSPTQVNESKDQSLNRMAVQEYLKNRIQFAHEIATNQLNSEASIEDNVKPPEDHFKVNKSVRREVIPERESTQPVVALLSGFCQDMVQLNASMWDTVGAAANDKVEVSTSSENGNSNLAHSRRTGTEKKTRQLLSSPDNGVPYGDAREPYTRRNLGSDVSSKSHDHQHAQQMKPNSEGKRDHGSRSALSSTKQSTKLVERDDSMVESREDEWSSKEKASIDHKSSKRARGQSTNRKSTRLNHRSSSVGPKVVNSESPVLDSFVKVIEPTKVIEDIERSRGIMSQSREPELTSKTKKSIEHRASKKASQSTSKESTRLHRDSSPTKRRGSTSIPQAHDSIMTVSHSTKDLKYGGKTGWNESQSRDFELTSKAKRSTEPWAAKRSHANESHPVQGNKYVEPIGRNGNDHHTAKIVETRTERSTRRGSRPLSMHRFYPDHRGEGHDGTLWSKRQRAHRSSMIHFDGSRRHVSWNDD